MLKKTALLVFGLAAMLVCINPPQASAGVIITLGPTYPRPVRVYAPPPYAYVAPGPYIAYRPYPYAYAPAYVYPGPAFYPRYYRHGYWVPRRYERREFVVRHPYWRR